MKTKILTVLVSALCLTALTVPAQASNRSDKVALAVGGFIGGVILGSHLDNNRSYDRGRHEPAIISCPPPARHGGGTTVIINQGPRPQPQGYWKDVTERVWVPSQRVVSIDSCGRRVVTYTGGCYEYRTSRVWVETNDRYAGRW